MYGLDVRAPGSSAPARCGGDENAPYVWLDGRRLLTAMLPDHDISGLFEEYSRPALHGTETLKALREGLRPTASSANSGADAPPENGRRRTAIVRTIDVESRTAGTVGTVPIHPFAETSPERFPDGRGSQFSRRKARSSPSSLALPAPGRQLVVRQALALGELSERPSCAGSMPRQRRGFPSKCSPGRPIRSGWPSGRE